MELITFEEKLAFYDKVVAMNPNFERLGKSMPYTGANTYMFTLLNKAGEIGIRLSPESGKKFMEAHNSTIYKSHGAVMKDYVLIPISMYSELDLLSSYFQKSYEYTMSLKPRKRKKK